jgi:hypothetical protein
MRLQQHGRGEHHSPPADHGALRKRFLFLSCSIIPFVRFVCDTFTFPVLSSCTPPCTASCTPHCRATPRFLFSFVHYRSHPESKLQLITSPLLVTVSKGSDSHIGDFHLHRTSPWQANSNTPPHHECVVQSYLNARASCIRSAMHDREARQKLVLPTEEKKQYGGARERENASHPPPTTITRIPVQSRHR